MRDVHQVVDFHITFDHSVVYGPAIDHGVDPNLGEAAGFHATKMLDRNRRSFNISPFTESGISDRRTRSHDDVVAEHQLIASDCVRVNYTATTNFRISMRTPGPT